MHTNGGMTLDEKVRYGMMAIGGASVVFATLGLHLSPLDVVAGGYGN
jgi:small-conductance mechanosensitive channel